MRRSRRWRLFLLGFCALTLMGCHGTKARVRIGDACPPHRRPDSPPPDVAKGPPPWAPAHGRRAKYTYRYYPSASVYHDSRRGIWFYYEDGEWKIGANLPVHVKVEAGEYVTVEMDTDSPYLHHDSVSKRYPPGLSKAKKEKKS